ncbi:MAG: zinc ABC transporter substrate-binding protein [Bacillota bacterium]|nr:zinc ABC transporter substrate-binding protein [Bacillota bacterium]MDW7676512.1 zinc ABC transporter substrate-binding protein [Bacillota bacterium]
MQKQESKWILILMIAVAVFFFGCSRSPAQVQEPALTPMEDDHASQEEAHVPEPKLKVVASFYPYYNMVEHIGGHLVDVQQMVPDGTDPHSYEPNPRDLIQLEEAHLFIYNGLGFETWMESVLLLIEGTDTRLIEAASFVDLLPYEDEDGGHDHDEITEHDHNEYDPHIWTDPMNMKLIAEAVKAVLEELDPENASVYEENYLTYAEAIDQLDDSFRQLAEESGQTVLLVSHSAFGYMAHRYGFREIAVTGVSPHVEPNPGRLAELTNLARDYRLEYIFFETLANPKTAEVLANEAGLTPLMLYNLEGLTREQKEAGETYFSLMHENVKTLRKALVK